MKSAIKSSLLILILILCSCSVKESQIGPFTYEETANIQLSINEEYENKDFIDVEKAYLLFNEEKEIYIVVAEIETDKSLEERTISVRKGHIASHRVPSTVFVNANVAIIKATPSESDSSSFLYLEGLYDEGNKKYVAIAQVPCGLSENDTNEIIKVLKSIKIVNEP